MALPPMAVQADGSGELTVRSGYSDEGAVLSVAALSGCSAAPPKSARAGHDHALRLDLRSPAEGDGGATSRGPRCHQASPRRA
jgi:hypothetical protein